MTGRSTGQDAPLYKEAKLKARNKKICFHSHHKDHLLLGRLTKKPLQAINNSLR